MTQYPRPNRAFPALALAALTTATNSALALDSEPLQAFDVPIWTGIYAGLHAGGNWLESSIDPYTSAGLQSGAFGGHVGIMTQFSSIVLGVEADLDYKTADASQAIAIDIGAETLTGQARASLSANGTLRGRLGVAVMPELLLYATAGYAWATVDASIDGTYGGQSFHLAQGATLSGVVYGLGLEAFITPNVLLRVEALHIDYDDQTIASPVNTIPDISTETSSDVIRAGISWRFN